MIIAIEKRAAAAPCKTHDEIFPAEFEGTVEPSKYHRIEEKKTGAFVTVPEITGLAFFFFIGGGFMGHTVHATTWGGEFGVLGMIIGIFVGVIGREKIKGVFRTWYSHLNKKSLKSRSVSVSPGPNGLARSR